MTKDEALKMAIEALDTLMIEKGSVYQKALQACKEALEQQDEYVFICKRCGDDLGIKYVEQPAQEPAYQVGEIVNPYGSNIKIKQTAQEPVAEVDFSLEYDCALVVDKSKVTDGQKLYTHPAPLWQGLSDDEIDDLAHSCNLLDDYPHKFVRAIEQALKEKNHA